MEQTMKGSQVFITYYLSVCGSIKFDEQCDPMMRTSTLYNYKIL